MLWCVWAALLVAMPYNVGDITGPVVPGQLGMLPLSLALIVLIAWRTLVPATKEAFGWDASGARRVLVRLGQTATIVWVVAEAYAVYRGREYLLEPWLVDINIALAYVEAVCSFLAVVGCSLSTRGSEDFFRDVPESGSIAPFVLGGAVPAFLMLLADAGGFWPALVGLLLCLAVGIGTLAALRRFASSEGIVFDDVLSLLSGLLMYQIAKAIVGELQFEQALSWIPPKAAFGLYLLTLLAFAGALALTRRRGATVVSRVARRVVISPSIERGGGIGISSLLERAAKPLTERERAVLSRTLSGESASRIAEDMGLSKSTIATYRRRCCEKLGVDGVQELIALAETYSCVEGKHEEPAGTEPASGRLAPSSDRKRCAFLALILMTFVIVALARVPSDASIAGGWFHRLPYFYLWSICAVLVGISVVRAGIAKRPVQEADPGVAAGGMIFTLTLSEIAYCIWMAYGPFSRAAFVATFVLGCLAAGMARNAGAFTAGSVLRTAPRAFLEGFEWLLISQPLTSLFAAAALSLSSCAWLDARLIIWPLSAARFLCPLTILASVGSLLWGLRVAQPGEAELAPAKEQRAVHYLLGRGLGELQAMIVLDLARGCRTRDICARRHVAASTVRSYRQRAFGTLGVRSSFELRELLSREAGVTTI